LLLPLAAFAVHQLRYVFAYGSSAEQALAAQGHGYVNSLAPWLGVLLAFAAGGLVLRVSAGLHGHAVPARRAFAAVWALAAASLLALYVAQEALEELFATGHPTGVAGVFGHGGWWAIPLALALSAIVAACVGIADDLVEVAVATRGSFAVAVRPLRRFTSVAVPRLQSWAFAWLGRGPPYAATFAA
jgi:hypothetical protein